MRPITFRDQILQELNAAGLEAHAVDGEPGSGLLYGITINTPSGKQTDFQIAARAKPGDDYDTPEPNPTTGTPPALHPTIEAPTSGKITHSILEAAIAAAATRIPARFEIKTVDRYSTRQTPPTIRYGVRVECHDDSALFVQAFQ